MRFNIRRLVHGANMLRHGIRIATGSIKRRVSSLFPKENGGESIRPKTPRTTKPKPTHTQVRRGTETKALVKTLKLKKYSTRRGKP